MGKIALVKTVAHAVLMHMPGLILMACIHWTWLLVSILVMAQGIAMGLAASGKTVEFTSMNIGPISKIAGESVKKIEAHKDEKV